MNTTNEPQPSVNPDTFYGRFEREAAGTSRIDWGRVAYYVLKFVAICAVLTAMVALWWCGWMAITGIWNLGVRSWDWAVQFNWKRGFYTVCVMAIFFYAARAIRAVARYFEAKTKAESRKLKAEMEGGL